MGINGKDVEGLSRTYTCRKQVDALWAFMIPTPTAPPAPMLMQMGPMIPTPTAPPAPMIPTPTAPPAPGACPGQTITAHVANGRSLQVQVPTGVQPGQIFDITA